MALELAQKYGAEIINMDSMQVYSGIGIISAAPNKTELSMAPHHLFLHVSPSKTYSTGAYLRDAKEKYENIRARNKSVIFVGGTGLYAHALTQGLVEIPEIDETIRSKSRAWVEQDIKGAYSYLQRIDEAISRNIKPNDGQRIARAIEVFEATEKPLSEWQKMPQNPLLPKEKWSAIRLLPERAILHKNIETRFRSMMNNGGIEEVEELWKLGLSRELPALKALGIPHLLDYFDKKIDIDTAIDLAIIATRQYAKRQFTWANNRARDWPSISAPNEMDFTTVFKTTKTQE